MEITDVDWLIWRHEGKHYSYRSWFILEENRFPSLDLVKPTPVKDFDAMVKATRVID